MHFCFLSFESFDLPRVPRSQIMRSAAFPIGSSCAPPDYGGYHEELVFPWKFFKKSGVNNLAGVAL